MMGGSMVAISAAHPTGLPFPNPLPPITGAGDKPAVTSSSTPRCLPVSLRLPRREDTVTWNSSISAASHRCRFRTSIHLFLAMLPHSPPDALTLRLALAAAMSAGLLRLALQVHAWMIKLSGSCSPDLIAATRLIRAYGQVGCVMSARHLFDRIPFKDVVACAAMMAAYNDAGMFEECIRVFVDVVARDCLPANEFVSSCALRACAGLGLVFEGEQVHGLAVKTSISSNVFVGTGLVDMYVKCDLWSDAELAFLDILVPNVASWNALLSGSPSAEEAMEILLRMRLSGLVPDHWTLATALRAREGATLREIQQVHALAVKLIDGAMDVFIAGALFERYLDQDEVDDARLVFSGIQHKDLVSFNLAIKEYSVRTGLDEAVRLFHELIESGKEPNEATFILLMTAVEELNEGKQLHALAVKFGCSDEEGFASSLIKIYSEFDCLEDAARLFDQFTNADVVLWSSLITGFSSRGEGQRALKLYLQMVSQGIHIGPPSNYILSSLLRSCSRWTAVEEGKQIHGQIVKTCDSETDLFLSCSLLDMYAKCGYIDEAKRIFKETTRQDLAFWNSMISSLARHGHTGAALSAFHELLRQPNMKPNHITYVGVLSACSHGGLVREGYEYFSLIEEPTIDHYACLIDLNARAGRLEQARELIECMPFQPNELIWSSLLAACRIHRHVEFAEHSAKHLLELNPNDSGTYIALSNVYADVGRWKDVKRIRKLIKNSTMGFYIGSSWLGASGNTMVFHADQDH